jgi:hypothetical protein
VKPGSLVKVRTNPRRLKSFMPKKPLEFTGIYLRSEMDKRGEEVYFIYVCDGGEGGILEFGTYWTVEVLSE